LAKARTSVVIISVCVITGFGAGEYAVTTLCSPTTRASKGAGPAGLACTKVVATIASNKIAVITFFGRTDSPIAAHHGGLAGLVSGGADVVGFDHRAVCGASVIAYDISIIAGFFASKDAIAALLGDANTGGQTHPAGLDGAGRSATISIIGIAVITGFGAG